MDVPASDPELFSKSAWPWHRPNLQQMLHPTASGNDASENVAKHMHKMHSAAFSHQPTLINITQSYAKVYATLLAWPIAMRRSAKGRKVLLARSGQSAALKMPVWGREKKRSALGTFFDAITSTPSVTPISGLLWLQSPNQNQKSLVSHFEIMPLDSNVCANKQDPWFSSRNIKVYRKPYGVHRCTC